MNVKRDYQASPMSRVEAVAILTGPSLHSATEEALLQSVVGLWNMVDELERRAGCVRSQG